MRRKIISKLKIISKNWIFWLILVSSIGIFIRLLPAYINPAWGVDFGIYYGLTNYFIESKELFNPYTGWGNSYQFFPVLYAISGFFHWITGIGLIEIMPKIIPIFGGLTIPIFYFIVYELMKDRRIAIFSAALLSVATFHVYQTSHAAPLAVGHFFMMLSFYFFIKFRTKKKYIFPLLVTSILLILSHHFTTYFYIISIIFILFSVVSNDLRNKKDLSLLLYISIISSIAFIYWAIIAKPVFYNFMESKMFISPYIIILLFYSILFGGFIFIKLTKNYNIVFPRLFNLKRLSNLNKFLIFTFISIFISFYAANNYIPGVYVKITPLAIIYSLPMIILLSLSFTGYSKIKNIAGGNVIHGWTLGLSISLLYSIFSSNLYPDRHLEYIIIPLCVPAAIMIKNMLYTDKIHIPIRLNFSPFIKSFFKKTNKRTIISVFISIMCISNMIAAYPTIDALNHIDERVTKPCINVFQWMDGNISKNSVIASDHRLEMLLWAEGFNITKGRTNKTWTSNNTIDCFFELKQLKIEYILIDDIMKNSVVNVDISKYFHMSNFSYEKFTKKPFELVYRNVTFDNNGIELHWVELYKIEYNQYGFIDII